MNNSSGRKYRSETRLSVSMKSAIKSFLDAVGINAYTRGLLKKYVSRIKRFLGLEKIIIFNVNGTDYQKRCLLVYIIQPFTAKFISDAHQNQWQTIEMARVIGTFGYNVDVIDYGLDNAPAKIKHKYDLIVGLIPREIDFWNGHMNTGCLLVSFMTGMNPAVTQANERQRILELEQRRGCRLKPRLQGNVMTRDIEDFNAVWFIGNSYNYHSYDTFKMPPVSYIKNNGYSFDWVKTDIVRNKHNFIFFASRAQVHKGLDLLLDIFGRDGFPYNLYICSSFMLEKDFCKEYHQELYNRPNIFPIGYININSDKFRELTEKCAYNLMPSCAEGCAGSVLTMMSAGVIPIASDVCGFEDDEVIMLPDCRIETLERYIMEYAQKPDAWIRERSEYEINIVRTRYSKDSFTKSVHDAMTSLLKGKDAI